MASTPKIDWSRTADEVHRVLREKVFPRQANVMPTREFLDSITS